MNFVELGRCFVRIGKDQEPNFDIGRLWGRKMGGWLEWPDLRQYQRVVLLAEASSGKTAEFRNQVDILSAEGQPAFFVRIEELADQGFEAALELGSSNRFEQWRDGTGEGWFFLDSVDEARLNRKSFESALKRFTRELGKPIERARIFVSCRVSDWKGRDDRALIERLLPAWEQPRGNEEDENASPLLDPIFKQSKQTRTRILEQPERKPTDLLVVQLAPLSTDQYRCLATALGVKDVNSFVAGINQNGLDAFTERPGDLIDLASYWKSHGHFASFAKMVEHSMNRKLGELDVFRPDNETLSLEKARKGAKRLAAALTLGKSSTLRAPGVDPDPSLASGALDPALILEEWTDAERNALLRRGIFAPSTYGRIRFHNRSTQEYLTALWLDRILRSNCPRAEVWDLIFASRYGVETVVPSLRPEAAWLALRHPYFLEEIIRREPLILVRHGDPGSLPLEARKRLLATYAAKHAAAEIADDSIDHRALWMFAHPDLADGIREAWNTNSRSDFRMDLLRLIREGAIDACADLARGVAIDQTAHDYHRIQAIQALDACKDQEALASLAKQLVAAPAKASAHLASSFAKVLFPRHLTTEELVMVIEGSQSARQNRAGGFAHCIEELYDACPDGRARCKFAARLAEFCLSQPFVSGYQRISSRHLELAKHLGPIAEREVQALGSGEPSDYLVRLLMVIERAERNDSSDDESSLLCQLVQTNARLQRALFWADVGEQRANSKSERQPFRLLQIYVPGTTLWQLGKPDLPWLYEDLSQRTVEADQRIALSAIVFILQRDGDLERELNYLREVVETQPVVKEDLGEYLTPSRESEMSRKYKQEMEGRNRARAEKEEKEKASWVDFSKHVRENLDQLRDPRCIRSWRAGVYRLWYLSKWLRHRTGTHNEDAPRQWRLLEEGFGREVAEAYRDGMKVLWRITEPERPKRSKGGTFTIKYTNTLAFGAVGLEATEDPDWTSRLSNDEAKRAALHGCLAEQGYPGWIETLLRSHPHMVLPVLKSCIRHEWLSRSPSPSDFINYYASPSLSIAPGLQQILFQTITEAEPNDLGKIDIRLRIIKNLDLDQGQIRALTRVARRRLVRHLDTEAIDLALRYLSTLLLLDPDTAVLDLETWLGPVNKAERQPHAERTFEFLFDRHNAILSDALTCSVPTLEKLLRLAYSYVRPEHDIVHEGGYSPNLRDHAQSARDVILSALLHRSGVDAFRALRRVSDEPEYALRAERFRELAHGKAERDAEMIAWSPREVIIFERKHTAPVKTGIDLLLVIMAVLSDIQFQLHHGDVSSRPLLERANDEAEVQNWIVEQMNYRSHGRFHAHREPQVAGKNKPDVIVSSTAAPCEVGLEVKHGGMSWTVRQLEKALRNKLAKDYLKPSNRRHGLLVITHHGIRHWRDPETKKPMTFDALIHRLDKIAETLTENYSGPIEVKCFGIDASPSKKNSRQPLERAVNISI
jgi:hypothetical protein